MAAAPLLRQQSRLTVLSQAALFLVASLSSHFLPGAMVAGSTLQRDVDAYLAVVTQLNDSSSTLPVNPADFADPCGGDLYLATVCLVPPNKTDSIVQRLVLSGDKFSGTLSSAVANFTALASLTITDSLIEGNLPSLDKLSKTLNYLKISNNLFIGKLPLLQNLSSLDYVDFSHNRLNGTLAGWMIPSNCTTLDLRGNRFRGPLNITFTGNTVLTSLRTDNNRFQGPLPSNLASSPSLTTITLNNNSFSGPLLSFFQNLPSTVTDNIVLNIANNSISGTFPASLEAAIDRFSSISIDISNNNISGYVSPKVASNPNIRLDGNPGLCGGGNLPQCPSDGSGKSSSVPLIAGVVSAAVICLLIGCAAWYFLRGPGKARIWRQRSVAHLTTDGPITFTHEDLVAATNGFHFENLLGRGGFGHVYKGVLRGGMEVAVKVLNREAGQGQGEQEYHAEVQIISHIHHRYLVQLVGFCSEGDHRMLVYEMMANGNLAYNLHEKEEVLSWAQRMKVAVGSAKGLAYLHEDCTPRIVHRDIKPSNILLSERMDPKIADFGLAKLMPEGDMNMTTRVLGTWGYVAPEYVAGSQLLGTQGDIFSFGIVLLELVTGKKPLGDTDLPEMAKQCQMEGSFSRLVDPLLENGFVMEQVNVVATAALMCVAMDPMERPTMGRVASMLETSVKVTPEQQVATSSEATSDANGIIEGAADARGTAMTSEANRDGASISDARSGKTASEVDRDGRNASAVQRTGQGVEHSGVQSTATNFSATEVADDVL